MNTEKAVAFLKARSTHPEIIGRFHVYIESRSNDEVGESVVVSLMSPDKSTVYASIVIEESIEAMQLTGFDHRVLLTYPGYER